MANSLKKVYALAAAGDFENIPPEIQKTGGPLELQHLLNYQTYLYAMDLGNKKAATLIKKVKVTKDQIPLCNHNLLMAYLDPKLGLEIKPKILKTRLTEYKNNIEALDKKHPVLDIITKKRSLVLSLRKKQSDPAVQKLFDQVFKGAKWKIGG